MFDEVEKSDLERYREAFKLMGCEVLDYIDTHNLMNGDLYTRRILFVKKPFLAKFHFTQIGKFDYMGRP
jgi:hypothetical protein